MRMRPRFISRYLPFYFLSEKRPRSSVSPLNAIRKHEKLNKSLQDMLHNMDKFFGSLLEQKLRDPVKGTWRIHDGNRQS